MSGASSGGRSERALLAADRPGLGPPLALAGALLGGIAVYALLARPRLPARMVTHFDLAGRANGWGPRDRFLITFLGVVLAVNLLFLVVSRAGRGGTSGMKGPNRRFWLATPERRRELAARTDVLLAWVAAEVDLIFLAVLHATARANGLAVPPALGQRALLVLVLGLTALSAPVVLLLVRRLMRPPPGLPVEPPPGGTGIAGRGEGSE